MLPRIDTNCIALVDRWAAVTRLKSKISESPGAEVWMGSDHATDAQYVGVIDQAAKCANYDARVDFYRKLQTHGNR